MIADPGEVPEWPNGPVSKTGVPFGVPRVRIPPSPLAIQPSRCGFCIVGAVCILVGRLGLNGEASGERIGAQLWH